MNVTGWENLTQGKVVDAAYLAIDTPLGGTGLLLLIIFFVVQAMILIRTRNLGLASTIGLIFYVSFLALLPGNLTALIVVLILFQIGGILYYTFFK